MTARRGPRPAPVEAEARAYAHARALDELRARVAPARPNEPPDGIDAAEFPDVLASADSFRDAAWAVVREIRAHEAVADDHMEAIRRLQAAKERRKARAAGLREKLRNVLREHVLGPGEKSFDVPGALLVVPEDRRVPVSVDLAALPPDLVIDEGPTIDHAAILDDAKAGRLPPRYIKPGRRWADEKAIKARIEAGEVIDGVEAVLSPQPLRIHDRT